MNEAFKQRAIAWNQSHVNRNWDTDGFPTDQPYQCYDLAQLWAAELGAPRFYGLYASDIITQPGSKFRRINNSPEFVPQVGDVCVFTRAYGGGYGHVSIATGEGDTNYFVSLDQNWNRPTATFVRHDYSAFIGVLRPLASEAAAPAPAIPTPSADNRGIVNGAGLRGRTEPNMNASSPWYFDDLEEITLHAKTRGQAVTVGPYAPSDWWYLAQGKESNAPRVWVSDAYIRTRTNPANVPDWLIVSPAPLPPTPPAPVYSFTKDVDCVTEVRPAHDNNFETGNFPDQPEKAVIHDFGTRGVDTIGSLINTFTKFNADRRTSSHFAVSGKRIVQLVSLKDRAFHAGANGNSYVGIETDPAQDAETITSTKLLLTQLRTKYGRQLGLIEHNALMATSCGDDVDLANYDITVTTPDIPPNPPADPNITDRLNAIELFIAKLKELLARIGINI